MLAKCLTSTHDDTPACGAARAARPKPRRSTCCQCQAGRLSPIVGPWRNATPLRFPPLFPGAFFAAAICREQSACVEATSWQCSNSQPLPWPRGPPQCLAVIPPNFFLRRALYRMYRPWHASHTRRACLPPAGPQPHRAPPLPTHKHQYLSAARWGPQARPCLPAGAPSAPSLSKPCTSPCFPPHCRPWPAPRIFPQRPAGTTLHLEHPPFGLHCCCALTFIPTAGT